MNRLISLFVLLLIPVFAFAGGGLNGIAALFLAFILVFNILGYLAFIVLIIQKVQKRNGIFFIVYFLINLFLINYMVFLNSNGGFDLIEIHRDSYLRAFILFDLPYIAPILGLFYNIRLFVKNHKEKQV